MIKKILAFIISGLICQAGFAQDDLLNSLSTSTDQGKAPVFASFKSTRLVNLHTNEQMKAKHLDFRVNHRFGYVNGGTKDFSNSAYTFFGMDGGASIRIGFDYGITDRLMVGVGRSNINKLYDGYVKYKIKQQEVNGFPFSISYMANTAIMTTEWADKTRKNLFSSRLSFVHQLILARKFNDHFSLLVSPTYIHRNLVPTKAEPNDIYAIGVGGSVKITRSTRFNIEYSPRLNGRDTRDLAGISYQDAISVGFDIETGGHVFQVHFTNSAGMIEQAFIPGTTGVWEDGDVRYGFNISRTFSLGKSR